MIYELHFKQEFSTRFVEATQIFFEECFSMGTIDSVLIDLGWKKGKDQWNPPVIVAQDMQTIRVPSAA